MSVFFKLAWRNLFRNKRRTIIAGIAIGIGLAALIFTDALIIGMERNMVQTATSSFMGEGQIHRRGFRETMEVDDTINDLKEVTSGLESDPIVEHFSLRVMTFGILTSPANVGSATIVGVDPSKERWLSEVDDVIVDGTYFKGADDHSLILGSKLADILEVGLGDRVVITAARAGSGELAQEMFRVSGIYSFQVKDMDQGLAFIRLKTAQRMLGLPGAAHEIALKFTSPDYGNDRSLDFWRKYSQHGNEAIGWTDIFPQMETAFKLSEFSIFITALILFGVVALGIINTLFMSIHERMFELGVIKALGTRSSRMIILIIFEAGALAIVSICIGIVMGITATAITAKTGIDYRGIEYSGVTMRHLIHPVLTLKQFVIYPISVFLLTVVISFYPAWYASRLSPAEAIRKSL